MGQTRKSFILDFIQGKTSALDALKNLGKGADATKADIRELQQETLKASEAQEQFNSVLAQAGRQSQIDDLARQYGDLAREQGNAEQQAAALLARLEAIGATQSEIEGAARSFNSFKNQQGGITKDTFGDSSSGLSAFAGAAGGLGLGGAGQTTQLAADLFGAAEQLPKLGKSVVDFATGLGPAGLAVTAVAGAVGLAVLAINNSLADLNAQVSANIEANADIEREIAAGLTVDDAKAKIEELNRQREAELQIIEKEKQSREDAAKAAADQFGILSGAATAFVNATSSAEETSATTQAEAEAAARKYQAEIDRLTQAIEGGELVANTFTASMNEFNAGAAQGAIGQFNFGEAVKSVTSGVNELTAAAGGQVLSTIQGAVTGQYNLGEAIQSTLNPLLEATAAHNQMQLVLDSYDTQKAETAAKRTLAATEKAQDAAIKEAQVKEDREEASAEAFKNHQGKLTQIEAQGNKTVENLRTQLNDGIAERLSNIGAAQGELAKLESDYKKQQLARQKQFEEDKLRLQETFEQDAASLIAGGQFDQLAELQRQNKSDKKDLRRDFRNDKTEAADQFGEAKAAAQAKIDELNAELEAFKANQQAKIDAAAQETQTALDNERRLFDEQEAKREAAYKKQDDREAAAELRREQRLKDAQTREDAALDLRTAKQLESIGTVEARQEAANLSAAAAFDILDLSIGKLAATAAALGGSTAQGIASAIPSPLTGTAFGDEGYTDKPIIAMLGEKLKPGQAEAAVKFDKSKGLPASIFERGGGGSGGGTGPVSVVIEGSPITVQGNADGVTVKKIQKIVDASEIKMSKVFNKSLKDILDGKNPT